MPDDVLSHLLGVPMEKEAARMNRKTVMVPQHSDHCPHCDFEFREKSYPRMKHEGKDVEDHAAAYESGEYDEHCPQCDGVIDQKEKSDEEIADSQGWDYPGRVEQETARRDAQRRRRLAREAKANEKQAKATPLATLLRNARNETHTHPTEAQAHAGNYRHGRLAFRGLVIALENPQGTTRNGKDKDGKPWESVLHADYGYFVGTKAADGDAVDCFLGPDLEDSDKAFIICQNNDAGHFDEPKVILGCNNEEEAKKLYLKHYPKGWATHIRNISSVTVDELKDWLRNGDTKCPYKAPGAREKSASGVSGLAADERALPEPKEQNVSALWGSGDPGVRPLVFKLSSLLGGHVSETSGNDAGPEGCELGLLQGKLPMDTGGGSIQKSAEQHPLRVSGAATTSIRTGGSAGAGLQAAQIQDPLLRLVGGAGGEYARREPEEDYKMAGVQGGVTADGGPGKSARDDTKTTGVSPAPGVDTGGGGGDPDGKLAKSDALEHLLKAKDHSDAKRYTAKKAILAKLIGEAPDDFTVDTPGIKYPGITHKPTGFKIHAPKSVAALIKEKQAIVKQDESSGEWILWTKDMKRKLGTHPTAQDAYKQEYAIQKSQERETEKEARSPSKGCLMVTLPPDAAKKTLAYAKTNIPDDQLAEDGIETDPHATVLYGFDNSVALGDLDLPTAPIDLKLGKVKRFKADDNRPGSDVLVIAVNSSAMTDLNAKLKKEHNVTSTYDSYAPHVTLAYVKPGALPELDGSDNFAGETFTADELVLSRTVDGERDKTTMQLTGKSASVLNILGLEKEAARPNFARNVGVGIAGAIPGRLLGELLAEQLAKRKIISGTNSLPGSVIRAGSAGLGAGVAQALDGQFQDHKWDEKGRKIKKPKQPKQEEAEEQAKAASLERARCQGYLDAHFKQASDSGFAPTSPQPVNYSPPAPAPVGQTSSGGGWGGIMSALGGGGAQQPAAPSPGSFTYGQPARPTAPPPEQGMWQSVGGAQGIGNSVKGFGEGVGNLAGSIAAAYNPYAAAAVGIGHGSNLIGDVVANKDRYWNKFMTGSDGGVARKDLVNRVEGFSAKDVKLPFEDTGWGKKFWGVSNSIMPLQNSILRGAVSTFGNAAIAGMNAFGDRADPNARAPLRAGPAKAAARSDGFLTMTLKNQGIDTDFNYRPPTSEILKRQVPILGGAASWSLPNMPFVAGASGLKLLGKAVGHAGPDINPATGYLDWFTKVVGHPATSRWKDALYRMTSGSNGKEPGLLGIGPMTTQIISQLNPWSK